MMFAFNMIIQATEQSARNGERVMTIFPLFSRNRELSFCKHENTLFAMIDIVDVGGLNFINFACFQASLAGRVAIEEPAKFHFLKLLLFSMNNSF